ncbi:uncharacterized protein LOC118181218 isoform X2 [Stegodyphus dumicola]|uniref:uncharacterized protein LOC118181218 isoform X2 n=1 Tax=Stegodyphus dumicola TaxID=202533 RepID=UPI0015B20799|nr:uncharacterized protein LOC118181218 isoform X2 [Stegodyphus dumicola]
MGSVITIPFTFALGLISVTPSDFFYWCKWILSYIYIEVNKRFTTRRFDLYDKDALDDAAKLGFIVPAEEYVYEAPYDEAHLRKAEDEIICYGVNSKPERLLVNISRRSDQKADACVYLKLESGKTYRLQKTGHFQQSSTDKTVFSCGDLQISYTCPMRRWRIFYSGYLRETTENDEKGRMVYVKFALRWRASSDVFDATSDLNSYALADAVAKANWKSAYPPLDKLKNALNFYIQSGVIHGTVEVEGEPEHEIYLFGQRLRNLGDVSSIKEAEIEHMMGYVYQHGAFVYMGKATIKNVVKDLCFGFAIQADTALKILEKITITIIDSKDLKFMLSTFWKGRNYKLSGSLTSPLLQYSNKGGEIGTSVRKYGFYVNGKRGSGFYLGRKLSDSLKHKTPKIIAPEAPIPVSPLAVPFTNEICQLSDVTGGKGSSLGKLTKLSKNLRTFIVPSGIVVTTSAYKNFVTKGILAKIKLLEDVVYGNSAEDVKEVCQNVCEEVERTVFPKGIREAIEISLRKTFGGQYQSKKFAVRSSATGEDTEQMSAAGQMDTLLGISGMNEILQAVKKCWASQFGFVAIQYKRRYGQCLNSPMAVVIQEMVPCDVAGVLFTCDPVTGNPTVMTITANYGLGESVVSGSEEPDTIELQRDPEDQLTLKSTTIGAKSRKIIAKDVEGITLEEVPENEKGNCCLSVEMIMRLGQLGIEVENYYRSHRDIEWGFWNNNLYLFQSRPVTSGTNETIFEIEHELDGPLRLENDYLTVSHIAEVMPGATTPLGMETFFKIFDIGFLEEQTEWLFPSGCPYFRCSWETFYNHFMFRMTDVFRGQHSDNIDYFSQATMIAFFGRILSDEELFQVCRDRFRDFKKEASLTEMAKLVLNAGKRIRKMEKTYANYRIPYEKHKTSKELYDYLMRSCSQLCDVFVGHVKVSQASTLWNMFIFTVLGKAKKGFDDDVYRDFSSLMTTSSDVISADVPAAIQSLAYYLSEAISAEEFKKMSVEEALNWLQRTPATVGKKFKQFTETHGHRCLREFDVYSLPWGTDPKPLIKLLQNLAGSVSQDAAKNLDNSNERLSKLSVSLGLFSRLILKFLLPYSRQGVQRREKTKSMMIKGLDEWRKGLRYLARLMVSEGRIPEEDLLFFMTYEEIQELLNTRSPKIIARAVQRQRRYPIMDKYIFPEIIKGVPKPINLIDTPIVATDESIMMKGIPICQGIAEGFVRVALILEEAAQLKPKEIMLTYSTDIGWTPYFPTLAGVVTELGGLISHGAVVSREYGIPCIAGMHGATRKFQTGDYVRLDGNTGVLQKIPPPKDIVF